MEILAVLVWLATLYASWVIFEKMGRQGWEGIVPFYNGYVLCEELYGNGYQRGSYGVNNETQERTSAGDHSENGGVNGGEVTIAPSLRRAFLFLEDGNWRDARSYCERALDQEPENAQAYLGKLMAELHVRKQAQLADLAKPFDGNDNFQKALRFADAELAATLNGYIAHINERNENARKDAIYSDAMKDMAAKKAKKIALIALSAVVAVIAFLIVVIEVVIPNGKYNDALALMDGGKYEEAITAFEALDGHKDSVDKIMESCKQKSIAEMKKVPQNL